MLRYCCYGTPSTPVFSATEDMLLLFRSFYRGGKGFSVRARAVSQAEFGNWGAWSSWSECSDGLRPSNCGACGTRIRTRRCFPSSTVCLLVLTIFRFNFNPNDININPCAPESNMLFPMSR